MAQNARVTVAESVRRWLAARVAEGEAPLGGGDAAADLVRLARLTALAAGTAGCAPVSSHSGTPGVTSDHADERVWASARRRAIASDLYVQRASQTAVRLVRERASTASRSKVRPSPPKPTETRACAAPATSTC